MIGIYFQVFSAFNKGAMYLSTINKFTSYTHNIAAIGGFWDATIGLSNTHATAEDWFENGLGRQIIVRSHQNKRVWEGFVNKVNVTVGSQTVSRGPLLDIGNRVLAYYTPRDFSVYPPIDGTETQTLLADDLVSQANYGIMEKSVAAGSTTETVANKVRDVFIEQYRLPKVTGDFTISGTGEPLSVTLDCLGHVHWLTVFPFNNLTPGLITAYTKLTQVLAASPNAIFSSDLSGLVDNSFAVEQLENKNRTGWDVANEILTLGNDTDDTRRIFGIYEDKKAYYNSIPASIDYEYKLTAQNQRVVDYYSGNIVYPWDVRPGKWIRTPDWLVGRIVDTLDLYNDPKNKFIENVNFSMPYTVGLTGSPNDKLSAMLAKITYTGGIY